MSGYSAGTEVEWNWGQGKGTGKIKSVHRSKITKTIKGSEVTRDASSEEPAYTIKQDDGDLVLKSHSEVSKA